MKYKTKPCEIEAIQYNREENIMAVQDWFEGSNGREFIYDSTDNEYYVVTLEGRMKVSKGDFIIKGLKGEFYPCKPDIFNMKYEKSCTESKDKEWEEALEDFASINEMYIRGFPMEKLRSFIRSHNQEMKGKILAIEKDALAVGLTEQGSAILRRTLALFNENEI